MCRIKAINNGIPLKIDRVNKKAPLFNGIKVECSKYSIPAIMM
jgi:hypothetical protein